MEVEPGRWLRLNPDNIAGLPDSAGVFEIANLVRNIMYVGRGDGSLRQRLATLGHLPANLPSSIGGYYFRFALTAAEEDELRGRLESYRAKHAGRVPLGNEESRPSAAHRFAARRAA